MEKGEGVELKKQYKVSAYPTLNFINGKGELQHCVVGGMPADALIAQAKLALEGKSLIAYRRFTHRETGNLSLSKIT